MGRPGALAIALPLWMCFGTAAGLHEPEVCYVLDGILFLYGLMLTTLYCRLKITSMRKAQGKQKEIVEHNEGSASSPPPPAQQWSAVCATRDVSGVKQRRRQEGSRLGEPLKNPSTQA